MLFGGCERHSVGKRSIATGEHGETDIVREGDGRVLEDFGMP